MSEEVTMSASEQKKEDWMNAKWRPMMGWMYMLVCTMDFVVFPILWSLIQSISHGNVATQWSPVTLQGAGLFHMAMGAVIGVAAFGRTQEKLAGKANDNSMPPSFGAPAAPTFGSSPTPSFGAPTVPPSFGSKPAGPGPTSFPAL
jgi:Holin of 3TMs, for gene-transfer release